MKRIGIVVLVVLFLQLLIIVSRGMGGCSPPKYDYNNNLSKVPGGVTLVHIYCTADGPDFPSIRVSQVSGELHNVFYDVGDPPPSEGTDMIITPVNVPYDLLGGRGIDLGVLSRPIYPRANTNQPCLNYFTGDVLVDVTGNEIPGAIMDLHIMVIQR